LERTKGNGSLDTSSNGTTVRLLVATRDQGWIEKSKEVFPPTDLQIQVQTLMTGICRSDIDMADGKFTMLPEHIHGHEGLGRVIAIGAGVFDVNVGDVVATRGEPAFADIYNCDAGTYVRVPGVHPRYILEPTACAVNIYKQVESLLCRRHKQQQRMAIIGTGFISQVFFDTLKYQLAHNFQIDVIGSHNQDSWQKRGVQVRQDVAGKKYDVVVDLKSDHTFEQIELNDSPLLILAAQKSTPVQTDFSHWLWKATTIVAPSPRYTRFIDSMRLALDMIEEKVISVDDMWTDEYNRDTEWQQAFDEMSNRKPHQLKGYIKWG